MTEAWSFQRSTKTNETYGIFACNECGFLGYSKRSLSTHKKKHNIVLHNASSARMKSKWQAIEYKEKVSNKISESVAKLWKDEAYAKKVNRNKSSLMTIRHKEEKINGKNVQCSLCKELFYNNANLKSHMRVHNVQYVQCRFCYRLFKDGAGLSIHYTFKHSENVESILKQQKQNREKTCLRIYGAVSVFSKESWKRQEIEETMLDRYGVRYGLQSKDIREKIANTNLERYGCKNVLSCKKIRDKAYSTICNRYGNRGGYQSPKQRHAQSIRTLARWNSMSEMEQRRQVEKARKGKRIECNPSKSCRFIAKSSYECWFSSLLDSDCNVLSFRYEPYGIPYFIRNAKHKYYPDFEVKTVSGKLLVEIKSSYTKALPSVKEKAAYARKYAERNNCKYIILTEKGIKSIQDDIAVCITV